MFEMHIIHSDLQAAIRGLISEYWHSLLLYNACISVQVFHNIVSYADGIGIDCVAV